MLLPIKSAQLQKKTKFLLLLLLLGVVNLLFQNCTRSLLSSTSLSSFTKNENTSDGSTSSGDSAGSGSGAGGNGQGYEGKPHGEWVRVLPEQKCQSPVIARVNITGDKAQLSMTNLSTCLESHIEINVNDIAYSDRQRNAIAYMDGVFTDKWTYDTSPEKLPNIWCRSLQSAPSTAVQTDVQGTDVTSTDSLTTEVLIVRNGSSYQTHVWQQGQHQTFTTSVTAVKQKINISDENKKMQLDIDATRMIPLSTGLFHGDLQIITTNTSNSIGVNANSAVNTATTTVGLSCHLAYQYDGLIWPSRLATDISIQQIVPMSDLSGLWILGKGLNNVTSIFSLDYNTLKTNSILPSSVTNQAVVKSFLATPQGLLMEKQNLSNAQTELLHFNLQTQKPFSLSFNSTNSLAAFNQLYFNKSYIQSMEENWGMNATHRYLFYTDPPSNTTTSNYLVNDAGYFFGYDLMNETKTNLSEFTPHFTNAEVQGKIPLHLSASILARIGSSLNYDLFIIDPVAKVSKSLNIKSQLNTLSPNLELSVGLRSSISPNDQYILLETFQSTSQQFRWVVYDRLNLKAVYLNSKLIIQRTDQIQWLGDNSFIYQNWLYNLTDNSMLAFDQIISVQKLGTTGTTVLSVKNQSQNEIIIIENKNLNILQRISIESDVTSIVFGNSNSTKQFPMIKQLKDGHQICLLEISTGAADVRCLYRQSLHIANIKTSYLKTSAEAYGQDLIYFIADEDQNGLNEFYVSYLSDGYTMMISDRSDIYGSVQKYYETQDGGVVFETFSFSMLFGSKTYVFKWMP